MPDSPYQVQALSAPSAERNRGPILEILRTVLPARGRVLEIASGTGQHVAHFAAAMPGLRWQPSDPDARSRASVVAWTRALANVDEPLALDVRSWPWPVRATVDAILCINMIHIAPWEAAVALFDGASRIVSAEGSIVLYGPYRVGGAHTAPSNEEFDRSLRRRDPSWGVRDLEEVQEQARKAGFGLAQTFAMPANNLVVVFRRSGALAPEAGAQ